MSTPAALSALVLVLASCRRWLAAAVILMAIAAQMLSAAAPSNNGLHGDLLRSPPVYGLTDRRRALYDFLGCG
jgi:hypothetical protein